MQVKILSEHGYEESTLGFSLSYNSTVERAKELLPKFAFKQGGENKFLESIYLWLDITAPRFWWQEADTYRTSTKQSESTMHTLMKNETITENMFEHILPTQIIEELQEEFKWLKTHDTIDNTQKLLVFKNMLPEGFLQRRIWVMSYKTLQNIINQRKSHKLPQWKYFIKEILNHVEHPEFLEEKEN